MSVAANSPAIVESKGPRSWLPGGDFWAFRRNPLTFLPHIARTYGDLARLSFGRQRVYVISRPEWIEDVLVTSAGRFAKGVALERARRILGNGLLTSGGADHLRQRRLIQPLFHRQHVQGFANTMVKHASRWVGAIRPHAELDMTAQMAALTLAIVGETLFSSDVQGDAEEVRAALTDAVSGFALAFVPMVEQLEKLPLPIFRRIREARARLDRVIRKVIAERRELEGKPKGLPPQEFRSHHDLISMLLAARDPENPHASGMTDEQIRDEAITIFLAGHETTANAMAWTWHLLSSAPEAEARLHAELTSVLDGRLPTAEDVPRLEWTRAIVSESMRLWPPAWTMGRRALQTHTIGGYPVGAGSLVIMSQWVVHRDPRWWDRSDTFAPERWLALSSRPKYSYFPFGGGSRVCIGESFAWTEAILLLATIAQRWQFRPLPGSTPEPEPRITLRPKGLRMRAEPRAVTTR
ncbi:MAG: cytochrome P450 [Vicinamibacterales bacterium]